MVKDLCGHATVGLLVVVGLLVEGAAPSHAWSRIGGMGGGGQHASVGRSQAVGGSRVFVNNRVVVSSRVFVNNRVVVGSRVFVGLRACCFGPRVFFGFGVGFPFWYPYPYAYPYPVYVPPAVVEPSPPVYVQQQPQPQYQTQVQSQYWYYCPTSQTYYPYVKECASGWLQVVPQTSPPPPTGAPR